MLKIIYTSLEGSISTVCLESSLTALDSLNHVHEGANLLNTLHSTITVFFLTILMIFGFSLITGMTAKINN